MDSNTSGSGCVSDETNLRLLLDNIRSEDESKRSLTIAQIPVLLLESMRTKNPLLNQLLLVIYNLNTTYPENFEIINGSNRTLIFRHLLRLYAETIQEHQHSQLDALTQIIDLVYSSELLVELAHVFYKCSSSGIQTEEDVDLVEGALGSIQDKAASSLSLEALLMVHSIVTIK